MLLSLLVGAAIGALAALALYLLQKLKKKIEEESGSSSSGSGASGKGFDPAQEEKRLREEKRKRTDLINDLVNSIEFASRNMISQHPTRGAQSRKSNVPTGFYNVRPIRGMAEFPGLLPSSHMLDDDRFYSQLASSKLMVGEFLEFQSKARNTLVVAVDGSGSMAEFGRTQWAIGLVEKLVDRCIKVGAEMFLVVFANTIRGSYHVHDQKSADELKRQLGTALSPDGGTNINLAIEKVFEIVGEGKFSEARALLVTDGTEGVDEKRISEELSKRKLFLHTVCIAGERADLKKISNKYDRLGMYN